MVRFCQCGCGGALGLIIRIGRRSLAEDDGVCKGHTDAVIRRLANQAGEPLYESHGTGHVPFPETSLINLVETERRGRREASKGGV